MYVKSVRINLNFSALFFMLMYLVSLYYKFGEEVWNLGLSLVFNFVAFYVELVTWVTDMVDMVGYE